jgi:hypothetical protein
MSISISKGQDVVRNGRIVKEGDPNFMGETKKKDFSTSSVERGVTPLMGPEELRDLGFDLVVAAGEINNPVRPHPLSIAIEQ